MDSVKIRPAIRRNSKDHDRPAAIGLGGNEDNMRQSKMSRVMAFAITAIVAIAMLGGCTSNQRAKSFGGEMTVEIPSSQQFVNATWKQDSLWYITAPRQPGHAPTTYTMREDSSFGLVEGVVKFVEK